VSIPLHFELNASTSIKSLECIEKQANNGKKSESSMNVDGLVNGNKKDSAELPTAEILRILNQFVFYLFLIYIVLLNLLSLWIFPYYIKEPLTLKG
jgi:hypothetical protein